MPSPGLDHETCFRELYALASDERDPQAKIDRAIEIGRDQLALENGVLAYTGDGEYEVVQTTIQSGDYVAGSITPLENTWCRHVVNSREGLSFADADLSEYADDRARDVTGMSCYVGTPVTVDGEVYGTLCFSSEDPRDEPFTPGDEELVDLLAAWIGYELERQKHHTELQRQNGRLDDFAGIVAHDLRNPLSSAVAYVEMAAEETSGQVATFLDRAAGSLDRMNRLIGECLSLAREGTDVGERVPVDVDTTARRAWETVDPDEAELEVATDETIRADRERLRRLFENLFRNVDEHCPPDTDVEVDATNDGFVVADDGPGLPPGVREALADDDPTPHAAELGLGLVIVSRIANGHDWTLTVGDDGARFEFRGVDAAPPVHEAFATASATD